MEKPKEDKSKLAYKIIICLMNAVNLENRHSQEKKDALTELANIIKSITKAEFLNDNEGSESARKINESEPRFKEMLSFQAIAGFIQMLKFNQIVEGSSKFLYLSRENMNLKVLNIMEPFFNLMLMHFSQDKNMINNIERKGNQVLKSCTYKGQFHFNQGQNNQNFNQNMEDLRETINKSNNNNQTTDTNDNNNININAQINELNDPNYKFNNPTDLSVCDDIIGKICLELSNKFRSENNLPPLKWDDTMWKIAYKHSENMGLKVFFSHRGFQDRCKSLPFKYSKACENIFNCTGIPDRTVPDEAVEGWINSPGHRKNLLSDTSFCAIATYKTGETFYLTQIFAKPF